jgi:potassium efflux system protein
LVLGVLDVDWTKFGWIAAGLSVGIGFGLQEVVANLVCGLMLLFESPIRMGDVVTVEGTTGTVTKIGIRATTITNWDRQECVVPNKNLITGTILNWTLTASVTRVTIPVGVAYGTDTEKARQILLDVAADHPRVVDDPAPMATFEAFADSSLTLCLLAYVPDVENRRRTITELHAEVDKRFATAGIEIAFPQQDLHLRTGWDDTRQVEAGGVEAEKEKK